MFKRIAKIHFVTYPETLSKVEALHGLQPG